MANAVITRRCNKSCSFCFAPNDSSGDMSLGAIARLAAELSAAGHDWLSLIGGEPTLHADFVAALDAISSAGLGVRLFTHGLLGREALEALERMPLERVRVIVNATATLSEQGELAGGVLRTLERLGAKTCLGVTIDEPGRPYSALLSLYPRYQLFPWFRLGLAQPLLDGDNAFARDYRDPVLAGVVFGLVQDLAAAGVRVHYDCGFVKCMFTAEQRAALERAGAPLRSLCGAMPDIVPNERAWPCYPLSTRFVTERRSNETVVALRRRMNRQMRGFRAQGLYPECPSCEFFHDRSCAGGCAARIVREFRPLAQIGQATS